MTLVSPVPYDADLPAFRGGGDTVIVDDSALLPEPTPRGQEAGDGPIELGAGDISIYVVRAGDTLSGISQMFGVSANTIVWANDLKRGSAIQPGQTLIILPISGVRHTVKSGDTLQSIAKKYHGDLEEIISFNDLTADASLAVGAQIIIPDGEIGQPVSGQATSGTRGSGPSYAGYYLRPIVGGRKSQGLHGYNGVDLAVEQGTPILASAAGTVVIAREGGWNGGYGNYIVIKHSNNTQTLYAHNKENIVRVGQGVVQGQVIGYVGSTGRSTGPHVHFEIRGAQNPF